MALERILDLVRVRILYKVVQTIHASVTAQKQEIVEESWIQYINNSFITKNSNFICSHILFIKRYSIPEV